nr:acyltransferase [Treponema sp.]
TRSYFTSDSIFHFYLKRIKKIFPPYLIVVFSSAILLAFISSFSIKDYFTNNGFWKYLAANVITLNFLHPDLPGVFNGETVNGSLWTIKIELGFYIILPFLLFLCFHNEKKEGRCFIVLLIFYFLSVLYRFFIPCVIDYYHLPSSIQHQLPGYITYFCVGMLFFFFYDKLFSLLNKLVIPAFLILVLCIILDNFYMSIIIKPLVLGISVMWFSLKCRPLFVLSKVYDFSYWLYLVHYPIILAIAEKSR